MKKLFLITAVVACGVLVVVPSCKKKDDKTYTCKCADANPAVADRTGVSESEANTLRTQECGTKPVSKLAKTTGINWACD
jgi:hypothetical protein